jgi:hypothetical protein
LQSLGHGALDDLLDLDWLRLVVFLVPFRHAWRTVYPVESRPSGKVSSELNPKC